MCGSLMLTQTLMCTSSAFRGKSKSIAEQAIGGAEMEGGREAGEGEINFSLSCYHSKSRGSGKENPKLKQHPQSCRLYSLLHPLAPFSPFLTLGCCVEDRDPSHQTRALWSMCLSAPDVSCVAGDTEGSFESSWHRFL